VKRSVLLALLLAGTIGAAEARVDCWVPARVQATTGYGDTLSAPRHAAMRQRLQRAQALLESDPRLNSIGGVRLQVKGFLGAPADPVPLAQAHATVGVHRPAVWGPQPCTLDQGRADYVVPIELGARFNDLAAVWQLQASPQAARKDGFFALPPVTGRVQGEPVYGGRVVLLTPTGVPALVPHTVADHLHHWERELSELDPNGADLAALRAHRKGLASAALQAPVALAAPTGLNEAMWAYHAVGTPGSQPMVRVNPALWRGQPESALRLISLDVWINNEGDALTGDAEAWLLGLDLTPWRALLQPGATMNTSSSTNGLAVSAAAGGQP
jgi:hypothetical protein